MLSKLKSSEIKQFTDRLEFFFGFTQQIFGPGDQFQYFTHMSQAYRVKGGEVRHLRPIAGLGENRFGFAYHLAVVRYDEDESRGLAWGFMLDDSYSDELRSYWLTTDQRVLQGFELNGDRTWEIEADQARRQLSTLLNADVIEPSRPRRRKKTTV